MIGGRLRVFSDLHQDWPENAWDPVSHGPPDGFDAVVAAGDVHIPLDAHPCLARRAPPRCAGRLPPEKP